MNFLKVFLLLVISIYGMELLGFALLQKTVIYPAPQTPIAACPLPDEVEIFRVDQGGVALNGIIHKARQKRLLVYFHGNGETVCDWRLLGKNHTAQLGFDTLVMEYPGYAGLDGKPSKRANLEMVDALAEWVKEADYEGVSVMGFSLGTAMAAEFAPKVDAQSLVLLAPFDRMRRVVRDHLPYIPNFIISEDYRSDEALEGFAAPVMIIHGAQDAIVPPARSEALADGLENVERVLREGLGHNDLFDDETEEVLIPRGLVGWRGMEV